jgi:hypothetical protein
MENNQRLRILNSESSYNGSSSGGARVQVDKVQNQIVNFYLSDNDDHTSLDGSSLNYDPKLGNKLFPFTFLPPAPINQ